MVKTLMCFSEALLLEKLLNNLFMQFLMSDRKMGDFVPRG